LPLMQPTGLSDSATTVQSAPNRIALVDLRVRRRGIMLLLLCAMLWSLNGPLIKLLCSPHHGQTGLAIAFWRSVFAGLVLLPGAWRGRRNLPRTTWWAPAILGFAAMCFLFVTATTLTQASSAIILQYTAPFWIFVLSPVLLDESPPRTDWFALPLAMLGIGVIFVGQYQQATLGLVLALASGIAFAIVVLSFRRLRHADPIAAPCIVNLATAVLLAPWSLTTQPLPHQANTWLLLALMGVVQMAIPYWLLAHALRHVPAAEASLITLCEPLMNTVWTYLIIGEAPRGPTVAGGGLILAALLLKAWLELRSRMKLFDLPPSP
jgi:DME family drug/metabolite transporter